MCDWLARHRGRLFLTLIAGHAALLAISAVIHTPDMNELGQMGAGLSHWETGRFHLHSVNPPLLRMISVVPVLVCTHMSAEDRDYPPHSGTEYQAGYVFVLHHGWQALTSFTLARRASIPFSLLGTYVCYRWANELYGVPCGLLPAALWGFAPLVLACGATIMPDVGTASFGVAAGYAFWRWLRDPGWDNTHVAGVALGLAELTRTLWLVLYVVWPLV